jgi:acyl-CoA thioester hydrolase
MPEPLLTEHEIQLRVRYKETDPMGYLHHANYLTYFEIARTEMLRASGGNYRQMEADGDFVVVVRAEVRYHRPARYDDLLTIRVSVVKVTPAKIEHEYGVLRDGELLASGHVTLAVVDRQGRVQRVPEWIKAKE